MSFRTVLIFMLALTAAGCEAATEPQTAADGQTPSSSESTATSEQYMRCNDAQKSWVSTGSNNLYGVSGTGVPLPYVNMLSPSEPEHTVTMDFTALTPLVNGSQESVVAYMRYTDPTGSIIDVGESVTVRHTERRYRLRTTIPSHARSAGIYFYASHTPAGTVPLLIVRNFRVRYSPNNDGFDRHSPLNVVFYAPKDGDTLVVWPGLIDPFLGSGISGSVKYTDIRASSTSNVFVSIRRLSDNRWWNGSGWTYSYRKLIAYLEEENWALTNVPVGKQLLPGRYQLIVSAHAGSSSRSSYCTEESIQIIVPAKPSDHDQGAGT